MASEKVETTKAAKEPETKYSKAEVLAASASFGVSVDLMAGALRLAGKQEFTKSEVEDAIRRFKKREV